MNGKIISSSNKNLIDKDFSKENAFINGLKKDTVDSFFTDLKNNPSVYLSGLMTKENKSLGVILIETSLRKLIPVYGDYIGLGETGEVTVAKRLINGDCLSISPLRFMPDSFLKLRIPLSEVKRPIIQAIQGKENIFPNMVNYRGKDILTVTRYIRQMDWGLTVNIDQDEVYKPLYELENTLFILSLFTSLVIILFSVYIGDLITKPILYVTSVAMKISKGDLKEGVKINSNDEIGMMANAINEMTENLIKVNEDLIVNNESLEKEIIERRKVETELEKFAYVSNHDLQEPLRTITSYTQLLERRYKDKLDDKAIEYINSIVAASKRMKNLIEDLLTYSKINHEYQDFKSVDLNNIVSHVIDSLGTSINENNVVINYKKLPVIKANYLLMIQLFQNIICNAIKYKNNNNSIIDISVEQLESMWLFSISDNGIGIESKYIDKIFVVFQRLHTRDKYEGTGIGLTICKKIVDIHKGKIWIKSELGIGSTFFFTIPIN